MQIYKFGGASIKDAASMNRVADIIVQHQDEVQGIVMSALGKTTNALEQVWNSYLRYAEMQKSSAGTEMLRDDEQLAPTGKSDTQETHKDIAHRATDSQQHSSAQASRFRFGGQFRESEHDNLEAENTYGDSQGETNITSSSIISPASYEQGITDFAKAHNSILNQLFSKGNDALQEQLDAIYLQLQDLRSVARHLHRNKLYDAVVSCGELASTRIMVALLQERGLPVRWQDARRIIKTDDRHRDAQVDWETTTSQINRMEPGLFITQGFIASTHEDHTTTLGREGSDYTAAILAHAMGASGVTIWKDVPGVLNADPRHFDQTQQLESISYREAIELAYYGASVIHPKTLQPLQDKSIPLHVRSFLDAGAAGTQITGQVALQPMTPCYILKKDMILLNLSPRDFSFISEERMAQVFGLLHRFKIEVGVMQTSAISLSLCVDDKFGNAEKFLARISKDYKLRYHTGVSLYTCRHYDAASIDFLESMGAVLLRQQTRETLQMVILKD